MLLAYTLLELMPLGFSGFFGILAELLALRLFLTRHEGIGRNTLSIALFAFGLYGLATLIYSITLTAETIDFFLRFGMISIVFAVTFLYFTMEIIVHSTKWIKIKKA